MGDFLTISTRIFNAAVGIGEMYSTWSSKNYRKQKLTNWKNHLLFKKLRKGFGHVLVKGELLNLLMKFYNSSTLASSVNAPFIALIPKLNCPVEVSHYRPISLICSLYKILAKVLSRRLRGVMDCNTSTRSKRKRDYKML
ncbi:hypothetical protein GQ457_11G022200 [Hibiscus cannabinus]